MASHTINYGHIVDPDTKQEVDEVMVSVMPAPHCTVKTWLKSTVTEACSPLTEILQLVLSYGARMAEPGEFTKRAFLNGRLDLSQSEAVMDLIRAKTDKSMKVALNQLDGDLSRLIRHLRKDILDVLAQVEVNIDYPEYDDVEEMTTKMLKERPRTSNNGSRLYSRRLSREGPA